MLRAIPALFLCLLALVAPAHADDDSEVAWGALRRGAIALVRHPDTSGGSGDPPGFRLDDCTTQRALNARGRQKAIELGRLWRNQRIVVRRMLSSQLCRCIETALLMDISSFQPFPALNNVTDRPEEAVQAQIAALKRLIAEWKGPDTLVLISHNSTIMALAGLSLAEGEVAVIESQPDAERGLRVVGRIPPPG